MGYTTNFKGAILVTPMVEPVLAAKINLYLNTRHDKILHHPEMENVVVPDRDLLGYLLPDFEDAMEYADNYKPLLAPHLLKPGQKFETALLHTKVLLNCPPDAIFSMRYDGPEDDRMGCWSDLHLIQDAPSNRSFLVWTNSEKTAALDRWVERIFGILCYQGYHCEGRMSAQGEEPSDQWGIVVEKYSVTRVDGRVEPTWVKEASAAQRQSEKMAKKEAKS